ncbi:response regulator [Demequina globuliformis]|uniref:response regulator n=1 Tax=Demequina globuliformis TaxID=676202 RepID=UPI0007842B02|nr:response regulator transcription factor [Demequina globuliformis]
MSSDGPHASPATITVVIADDDPMVRNQVRFLLDTNDSVRIAGEAADGHQAVAAVAAHRPDLVLMDVSMPGISGIEATRAIAATGAGTRVIALTALGHDDVLMGMLAAGAAGFVPKEYAIEDLEAAITCVARGDSYVSPHCQPALIRQLTQGGAHAGRDQARQQLSSLSDREREVANHVATGAKTAQIASALYVSESTVKSQLDSIRTKLGVSSREEIAVLVERAR